MNKSILLLLSAATILSSCSKDDDTEPAQSGPTDPVSLTITSIDLTGFNSYNGSGDPWDATSGPDPWIKVYRAGTLIYTSEWASNASPTSTYSMSAGQSGSLPITIQAGESLRFSMYDRDSATSSQYMGFAEADPALSFFYVGDGSTTFSNAEFLGTNGMSFSLTGTFDR